VKSVITLVGTSLMTNYLAEKEDLPLKNQYEKYRHRPASEYELNKDDIIRIKKKLARFASENSQASAEVKSLNKLSQELPDDLSVYLLASDTINSKICAEVLYGAIVGNLEIHFSDHDIIAGLQVQDRKGFAHKGMENLFKRIEDITGGYYRNTIINITGGYKAAIPLLTIFSQVNHIPAYYIFEDTEALMKIPLLPLSIDWEIFDAYADIFREVEKGDGCVDNWKAIVGGIKPEHQESIYACFEVEGNYALISTFGKLLWNKYKARRYIFYQNDFVKNGFKSDPNYEDYLIKVFDANLVRAKTENKNGHLVLDLGRRAPRIFYRIKDGSLYIYRYTRHNDDYERFINSNPFHNLDDYGPFKLQTLRK